MQLYQGTTSAYVYSQCEVDSVALAQKGSCTEKLWLLHRKDGIWMLLQWTGMQPTRIQDSISKFHEHGLIYYHSTLLYLGWSCHCFLYPSNMTMVLFQWMRIGDSLYMERCIVLHCPFSSVADWRKLLCLTSIYRQLLETYSSVLQHGLEATVPQTP